MSYINTTKLLDLVGATEIKIEKIWDNTEIFSINKYKLVCGEYSMIMEDYDFTVKDMIRKISLNKGLTASSYAEFMRNSYGDHNQLNPSAQLDGVVPDFSLLKSLGIRILTGPTGIDYPTTDLEKSVELIALTKAYKTYEEIDFSIYSHLYTVTRWQNGYKVRGVLRSVYEASLKQLNEQNS